MNCMYLSELDVNPDFVFSFDPPGPMSAGLTCEMASHVQTHGNDSFISTLMNFSDTLPLFLYPDDAF